MLIAVMNESTLVSNDDALKMTQAVAAQVRLDVAPLWDRAPAAVIFYPDPKSVPEPAHGIYLVDAINDQPRGVLGFHTEDQRGKLWGVVAAKPELDNGAQVTTGDWSVSSVLSHEVLEMFVDPNCNLWGSNGRDRVYSLEVCDPVEAPAYEIHGVSVANFVTPAWFDPQAPKTSQFDKLGKLSAPFGILPGGYVVYSAEGRQQQTFGSEFPAWRKEMKNGRAARTRRRRAQAPVIAA